MTLGLRVNRPGNTRVWGRSNRLLAAAAMALFLLHSYICRELFVLEYSGQMWNNESAISALAETPTHWGDRSWFPLWYGGIPSQNTYPPLLHWMVALAAWVGRISTARAHDWVTGLFYCLGPVTLFALVLESRDLAGRLLWRDCFIGRFALGMAYAFCCRRHGRLDASTPLVQLGLLRRWPARDISYPCPVSNFASGFGPSAEKAHVFRYGRLWPGVRGSHELDRGTHSCVGNGRADHRKVWTFWRGVTGRNARNINSRCSIRLGDAMAPSLDDRNGSGNARLIGGDYSKAYAVLPVWGIGLLLVLIGLRIIGRRAQWYVLFAIFFALLTALPPLAFEWFGASILPQPVRYHQEMEMALVILIALIGNLAVEKLDSRTRWIIAMALVLILIYPMRIDRRFARQLIQPIDVTKTSEWKTAQWLNHNWTGGRVLLPGSSSFWLNAFSDVPQIGGGFDQGITLPVIPMAIYQLLSGAASGSQEAQIGIFWLKALGVQAVGTSGTGSTEAFKPFKHPQKFEGVLPVLWRDGGDVLYRVSNQISLAHVLRRTDLVQRRPINGIDVEPLEPYVRALEDSRFPPASFRWINEHTAVVETSLPAGTVISIQESFHRGWHARINARRVSLREDPLGFMYAEVEGFDGPVTMILDYDGGGEMRIANWLSLLTGLGLIGVIGYDIVRHIRGRGTLRPSRARLADGIKRLRVLISPMRAINSDAT